jgi:hypothetical protein
LAITGKAAYLSNDVADIQASPDRSTAIFFKPVAPAELFDLNTGQRIATLSGRLGDNGGARIFRDVRYSEDGRFFLVNYRNMQLGELRRSSDGGVISSTKNISYGEFSPNGEYVLIDDSSGNVHLIKTLDGSTITSFKYFPGIYFNPTSSLLAVSHKSYGDEFVTFLDEMTEPPLTPYFIENNYVTYSHQDIIDPSNGLYVFQSDNVEYVYFNPVHDNYCILYSDKLDEIRDKSNNVLFAFNKDVERVIMNPNGEMMVVLYKDLSVDFYWYADDRIKQIGLVHFENGIEDFGPPPDFIEFFPSGDFVKIDYILPYANLFDSKSGEAFFDISKYIEILPNDIVITQDNIEFTNDMDESDIPNRPYVWKYDSQIITSSLEFTDTNGDVGGYIYGFSPKGNFIFVSDQKATSDYIYSIKTGSVITMTEKSNFSTYDQQINPFSSTDEKYNPYKVRLFNSQENLVLITQQGITSLWDIENEQRPYHLANLGIGLAGFSFSQNDRYLLVRYEDTSVYLIDIEWLKAMKNTQGEFIQIDALVKATCDIPLAGGQWSAANARLLEQYLPANDQLACR